MKLLFVLITAALLESGGDALVRRGLKGGPVGLLVIGSMILVAYGFCVNLSDFDFGRLIGIYISVLFVVSQVLAWFVFKEAASVPVILGGVLVVSGGLVMTFWKS